MRRIAIVLALFGLLAAPAVAQQKMDLGTVFITGWSVLVSSDRSYTLTGTASSKVLIDAKDGSFSAKADKLVITKDAKGVYQAAKLTGGVWLRAEPQSGRVTTATSATATIDYAKAQEAVLSGGVKITSTDPQLFIGPATVTGDRAIISLAQHLGPDEARIRIESDPEKSKLEFTPKPQQTTTEEKK